MMTAFMMLPLLGVLLWLYWFFLPARAAGRWQLFDVLLITGLGSLAVAFQWILRKVNWNNDGALWFEIVSMTGTYAIIAGGLAAGLIWRRKR